MKKNFFILFFFLCSCNQTEHKKPSSVPKDAIWKGGLDGGCWILFNSIQKDSIDAVIFYQDGGIWEQGVFKKTGNCEIPKTKITENITSFDGEKILFKDYSCVFKK